MLLSLVLLMELAMVCCACAHLLSHTCCAAHGEPCAVCACIRSGRRAALPPSSAATVRAAAPANAAARATALPRTPSRTPVDLGVRLND